nr:Rieske (2Fe-2S) protein [Nocardioides luti]
MPLLAACGGGDSTASDTASTAKPSAGPLTTTSDVEVGGGAVFADEKVVVTQPTEGDFKCFSAVCPHQGCLVASVDGGTINCTCHGSKFSIEDGSVENGPATTGLDEVAITVDGDSISVS